MIAVANRIQVAKGYEAAFEERFRKRLGALEKVPGFVRFNLLRPIEGAHYIVLVYWESREVFQTWTQSESFRKAHAERPPAEMFAGPSTLEILEVLEETEAAR